MPRESTPTRSVEDSRSEVTPAGTAPRPGPSAAVVVTLAVACGLSVANLYYAQPLLNLLADDFHSSAGMVALVVTFTQLGYALGLVLLVPLGDLFENRRLATRTLLATALSLAAATASPGLPAFLAASLAVGVTSVVAQMLVPLAAALAPEQDRGRIVGQVMSGLLLGILLARTVASLVAAVSSWRVIYGASAALMLVLVVVLRRMLPEHAPEPGISYGRLLRSLLPLLREEPVLRWRTAYQFCMFGSFTLFWTAISHELIEDHGLSQTGVGIFALVGAAGALAAVVAGRLGDRGLTRSVTGASLLLASLAMVLAAVGDGSVVLLGVAAVLLDLAVQANQVIGQRAIYSVRPEARARMNTVYIATFFLGGAIASEVSGLAWASSGWTAVAVIAAALPAVGFVLWLLEPRRR